MGQGQRIPVVAAYAEAVGLDYNSALKEYRSMSEEQREAVDECHGRTSDGQVNEAWAAYRIGKRGGEFSRQGFTIRKADGTVIRFPDKD